MIIYLVVGGSASGKSAFAGRLAERLADRRGMPEERAPFIPESENPVFAQNAPILYIATLADQGEESLKKVARHREMRKSGNYMVAECFSFYDLRKCCCRDPEYPEYPENMETKTGIFEEEPSGKAQKRYPVILFDSLDGFTADAMFYSRGPEAEWMQETDPAVAADRTVQEILGLEAICDHLVVVSDHVYSDGILYDEFTRRYMEYTSVAEQLLAERAAYVTEVVCGIPVLLKGNRDELSEIVDYHVVSLYEDSDAVS